MKLRWYPTIGLAIVAIVLLGSAWVTLGRVLFKAPVPTPTVNPVTGRPSLDNQIVRSSASPTASPTGTPLPTPLPTPTTEVAASPNLVAKGSVSANRQGVLRISNPTEYPVRVALLAKKSASPSLSSSVPSYDVPAHWDFAPQEGETKGLIVSLPDRKVMVRKGDVLVAFAEDGSRRYWGPYVVGETELPTWNPKAAEWELVLQP